MVQDYRGSKRKYNTRDCQAWQDWHTACKLNRGIVTKTSKYNLAEGYDLKKPIKVPLS